MSRKFCCHSERREESSPTMEDPSSKTPQDDKKGFVAITTVLILSAVVVAIATTVTLLSIGEAQSSLSLFKGEDNLSFVEGCVEDVMMKIRSNPAFGEPIGTPVNITHSGETCVVTVNSKTGSGTITWDA